MHHAIIKRRNLLLKIDDESTRFVPMLSKNSILYQRAQSMPKA